MDAKRRREWVGGTGRSGLIHNNGCLCIQQTTNDKMQCSTKTILNALCDLNAEEVQK